MQKLFTEGLSFCFFCSKCCSFLSRETWLVWNNTNSKEDEGKDSTFPIWTVFWNYSVFRPSFSAGWSYCPGPDLYHSETDVTTEPLHLFVAYCFLVQLYFKYCAILVFHCSVSLAVDSSSDSCVLHTYRNDEWLDWCIPSVNSDVHFIGHWPVVMESKAK